MSLKEMKKRSPWLLGTVIIFALAFILIKIHADESAASSPDITVDTTNSQENCDDPYGKKGPCEDDDDDDDHEHYWPPTHTSTDCQVKGRTLDGGGEIYCKGESIEYPLSETGERVVGKEETYYAPCPEDGVPYPGTNPEVVDHVLGNTTFKWVAPTAEQIRLTATVKQPSLQQKPFLHQKTVAVSLSP